jgi:pseudouridylate synthase
MDKNTALASRWLVRSAPVAAAQAASRPVVALESTIIAHGMPWPENVRTAREVEGLIRGMGVEPATIAVIDGRIRIGLSDEELELLGRSDKAHKVSRRDLPFVLASGELGATTVAATMICAALAGIEVFVTGGIGGVHRGAQETFDISADLQELAKTSVAVVCAGAKSILDIGLTLEYLETHGVPVLSCEQDHFAAFYTRDSGFRADFRFDDAAEQARFIRTKWELGLSGGVVLSTPVPAAAAMDGEEINALTNQALAEAKTQGITGKAVTPFVLARIKALTGGRSLATNIALVKHNAQVGARLALALAEVRPGAQRVA